MRRQGEYRIGDEQPPGHPTLPAKTASTDLMWQNCARCQKSHCTQRTAQDFAYERANGVAPNSLFGVSG